MKLRYKAAMITYGLLCTAVLIPAYLKLVEPEQVVHGQLYITAAHIQPESLSGYTLMYADENRDIAYYLRNDYEYHYPKIGDVVYFGSNKGVVEEIEEGVGFYVKIGPEVEVYQGMSGTRVRDTKGNEIAFIAQLKGTDYLLCVSLY